MPYTHGKAIKNIEGQDGTRRAEIVARNDGHFQAYEFIRLPAEDGGGWGAGRMTGLYVSAEEAESAALSIFKL